MSDLAILDQRPGPGRPRAYEFPRFERSISGHGLTILAAHVPGRPLLQAQLVVRGEAVAGATVGAGAGASGGAGAGASGEDPATAGVTVLTARALSEGTEVRDAVAFVEAAERLGASLGASAGWDSFVVHVEVPRARLREALVLLAEMALRPSFPSREVERLRDERLNDLKQAMADPRRRADRLFASVVYDDAAAYARPLGGDEATVAGLDRDTLVARHRQIMRASASTLVVCGDLEALPVQDMVAETFGGWAAPPSPAGPDDGAPRGDGARLEDGARPGDGAQPEDGARPEEGARPDLGRPGRRVVVVDRPDAPQSELRVGHVGTSRRVDDFHALTVMNALLGGLFNSRLNRLLREERGFTYGVHSGFDMRRGAGPFAVRCAVETETTTPAIEDIMAELARIREVEVETDELDAARDYLVGVFPLRFETSGQVADALAGLIIHDLPDDELDVYRPTVAAVSREAVLAAARRHVDPVAASIAVVGDLARFRGPLEEAGYAEIEVIRDEGFGAP
jgi:predicted Zn-dependent peptidase